MLDDKYSRFNDYAPADMSALRSAAESSDILGIADSIFNIFEEPVLSVRPVAAAIKQAMLDGGAVRAMMSGSGPSVYGIFKDTEAAELAVELIGRLGVKGHICRPV
jgi:4-diphosphocytidyl-2-C-methyl-D-erythritol kinase